MTNLGGYKIFRPRPTKYCRGCVPGDVDSLAFFRWLETSPGAAMTFTHFGAVYKCFDLFTY